LFALRGLFLRNMLLIKIFIFCFCFFFVEWWCSNIRPDCLSDEWNWHGLCWGCRVLMIMGYLLSLKRF